MMNDGKFQIDFFSLFVWFLVAIYFCPDSWIYVRLCSALFKPVVTLDGIHGCVCVIVVVVVFAVKSEFEFESILIYWREQNKKIVFFFSLFLKIKR